MIRDIVTNRKALRDFRILERLEVGIILVGTEVKSLRTGKADLMGSYACVEKRGLVLYDATIDTYEKASYTTHDPKRIRSLLLHKSEMSMLADKTLRKGCTLPALRMYWKNGKVKVEIGIAKGKNLRDKREDLKKRDEMYEVRKEIASLRKYN